MAEISDNPSAEQSHCEAFLRENADLDIRRPAHIWNATPLNQLATGQPTGILAGHTPESVIVRRSLVTLTTSRTSFDVWAALAYLEGLLSDYRRIAPRYSFMQTAGQASIEAENEYRLTLSDPTLFEPINTALGAMTTNQAGLSPITQRVMDVRVVRAGPWGGETGELVVEALQNHALAGASSLWVLAHDDSDDGNLRVTLDGFEIARWAWAPDLLACQQESGDNSRVRIIDWDYLFERLAQTLDGLPDATDAGASFSMVENTEVITQDDRIKEALRIHSGIKPFFDQAISL